MSKRLIHSKSKKGKNGPNSQDTLVNDDADNATAKYFQKSLKDVKTKPHEVDVDVRVNNLNVLMILDQSLWRKSLPTKMLKLKNFPKMLTLQEIQLRLQ